MIIWFVMVLFTIATIGILMAEINDSQRTRIITKPFLMPLLTVFYMMNAYEISTIVITALILSFAGDVLLLRSEKKTWFLSGLFSFLLMHILYSVFLCRSVDFNIINVRLTIAGIIMAVAVGALVYGFLFRYLGKLKLPVLLYVIAVLAMSFFSLLRMDQNEGVAAWMPFAGSLFFLLSDTLLAFNYFRAKINNGGLYILASYLFAQILIICGFILS